MNIEISDQASKQIEALLGITDQAAISRIVERVASDKQLLMSLVLDAPSDADIEAVREGIAESDAGLGQSLTTFDAEFRASNGFAPRESS